MASLSSYEDSERFDNEDSERFKFKDNESLLNQIFLYRNESSNMAEIFELISKTEELHEFSAKELEDQFQNLYEKRLITTYLTSLGVNVMKFYQETVLSRQWTEKQEIYLLKELFHHRKSWKARDFWTVVKAGAYSGPLEQFSEKQLRSNFFRLVKSRKLTELITALQPEEKEWFIQIGNQKELESDPSEKLPKKRKRNGWTDLEDEVLLKSLAKYGQERYRYFQDHEELPNKTEDEIYERYLDLLLDGNFIGKFGKAANHHRSEPKFSPRRPKRRWSQKEEEELCHLHAFFSKQLNNDAPWVQIWMASKHILSHRLTVDVKDKWRNLQMK